MGGRSIPVKCQHGITVDGGDFMESQRCAECEVADKRSREAYELGGAWAEAEAALPEGWVVSEVSRQGDCGLYPVWHAWAVRPYDDPEFGPDVYDPGDGAVRIEGPTPAAALRALAASLRRSA